MTDKRKMNMKTGGQGVDIDALIAGADPVSAPKPAKAAKTEPATTKKAPKSTKAPWEDLANEGRVNMPLYVTPQIKGMLDYLKKETGVPSQVTLRKIIEPELRKEAEKIFKGK